MSEEEDCNVHDLANQLSSENDCDIIIINKPVFSPFDTDLAQLTRSRKHRRKNVYVILVTEGGSGEVAYRACRMLQMTYRHITVVVSGWCKSAGTLFCAGANDLIVSRDGELGPIDVQLRRSDEIGERDSGLAIDAAFDGLSEASLKLFEKYMLGIKEKSFGSVTFKTAADIAAQMAVGLVAPIFAQLDPIKVGEIHRSVRVAEEYAKRLSMIGQNIKRDSDFDAINMLVRGYPSHGFVIDFIEAHLIFKRLSLAKRPSANMLSHLNQM